MTPSNRTADARAPLFRVLVVDDNPAIHEDFRKVLCPKWNAPGKSADLEAILFDDAPQADERTPFELEDAYQGQEALELIKHAIAEGRPYALAFVDVRMPPGWDGIETISHLWQGDPRLQVVICTAYSDYSWEDMRTRLGRSDSLVILKKPFDNIEVQQLAHALTRKWELNLQAEMKLEELESMVRTRTAELENANANLTRSEERFAKAFHTSPVAMGIQSLPDRRFVDVNERMVQLTGRTRDQMLDGASAAAPVWSAPHLVDEWVAALKQGEPVRDRETEVRRIDGKLRQVLVSLSIVTLSGQPHMLVVAQDVTERTLLERQLQQAQKMETVGQLAAGLAHDFNNILTVIQGHAGLIKSQPDSVSGVAESADEIKQAVDRASELIRQLLMFSRKQVMQFGPLDLNECVRDSRLMIARLVGAHIRIDFNPGASVPSIHADRAMIEQVIMNVAVNARDAMPEGGSLAIATGLIELHRGSTAADPETRRGRFVQLTFRDTGCGMPPHVLKRVFEPFFTTKEAGKGSGLGLSIVLGIVRQHRGWVEVDSQPGQGSEFRLHFPASEQQVEQRSAAAAAPSAPARGHETVLVVEDQTAVRGMISRFLTAQGYQVLTAASGVEALEVYRQATKPVDLLLTDVVMPGGVMGGELARRLRAASPGMEVIFISGYNSEMAGKDLSLLGERNFLSKPFTIGELARLIRQVLDQPVQTG